MAKFRSPEFRGSLQTSRLNRGTLHRQQKLGYTNNLPYLVDRARQDASCCYSHIGGRTRPFDWYRNRWPWMTLNGIVAVIWRYFTKFGRFRATYVKVVEVISYCLGWKCSSTNLLLTNSPQHMIYGDILRDYCELRVRKRQVRTRTWQRKLALCNIVRPSQQ